MKVEHISNKVMLPALINTDGSYIGMLHGGGGGSTHVVLQMAMSLDGFDSVSYMATVIAGINTQVS